MGADCTAGKSEQLCASSMNQMAYLLNVAHTVPWTNPTLLFVRNGHIIYFVVAI